MLYLDIFEDALMGNGANSYNDYKSKVGDSRVGPLDQEIWDLLVKVQDQINAHKKYKDNK